MKSIARSLAFVVCLLASAAQAQCLPTSPGAVRVGVTYKADGSAMGAWAYWWCVQGKSVSYEWRAAPVSSFSPTVMANLRSYAMGTNPNFIKAPWTLAETDPSLTLMRAEIAAAAAADAGKPKPAAK